MNASKKTEAQAEELRVKKQLWFLFVIIFIMMIVGFLAFNRQIEKVGKEAEELKNAGPLPVETATKANPL